MKRITTSDPVPETLPNGTVAVTVYYDDRHYGGPEEGGWWYTSPMVWEVNLFKSLRKAKVFLRTLQNGGFARGYYACLEFPGADPIGRDDEGIPCRTRPYELRPVFRHRELIVRPRYS